MPINGNHYDWESVEIRLPSGVAVGVEEISYKDERKIDPRYGKGSTPHGYGRGNYSATGSMTLDREEAEQLRGALGGGWYTLNPFNVVVSYANHDMPTVTDVLKDCHITGADTSAKQGDSNVSQMKFEMQILSPIEWNGSPAYFDGRDGAGGQNL